MVLESITYFDVKHKQKDPWGCGVYAVANAGNLDEFPTESRILDSKSGNNIGQLSDWLKEDGYSFYIDTLYYSAIQEKLPEVECHYIPIGEDIVFIPVLIQVKLSEKGKQHMVAGKIDKTGVLWLSDSLNERVVKTSLKGMNDLYHSVFGIYTFVDRKSGKHLFI